MRRNAVGIIREILAVSVDGVSKTRAVNKTNLNFRLMEEYLGFLTSSGYLQRSQVILPVHFSLTTKGIGLLKILVGLEREIAGFRAPPAYQRKQTVFWGSGFPTGQSSQPQTLESPSKGKSEQFTQSLNSETFARLIQITKERGTTLQELFRAVIVPEWLRKNDGVPSVQSK